MHFVGVLWAALGGYALGTLQVLLLDWVSTIRSHRNHLRLMRAELRRLRGLSAKFGWRTDGPGSDVTPKPPDLTPTFLQAVAAADFYLTDEHDNDNTQQALLELADGCAILQHDAREAVQRALEVKSEPNGAHKMALWFEAKAQADAYDAWLDHFQIQITSALEDMDRRLREASWWRRFNRPLGRLPQGQNPPSLPNPLAKPPFTSERREP